jgi:uncharacterized protein (DUF1697 family)
MGKYVALLRGLNVGGHLVKMEALRACFSDLGFENISTVLATGNVRFETEKSNPQLLQAQIEEAFLTTFGFESRVCLRLESEIKSLIESDPFKDIVVTPITRLYVSFSPTPVSTSFTLPYKTTNGEYSILAVTNTEIVSVLLLLRGSDSVSSMNILENEFGKNITTRNWNTLKKLITVS